MKKAFSLMVAAILTLTLLSACSSPADDPVPTPTPSSGADAGGAPSPSSDPASDPTPDNSNFNWGKDISVVSREESSGTRDAVRDLFNIKDADGKENVTGEAIIADGTGVMITNVANDPYAIGYCSIASLNDKVKALLIDGVAATSENVKNGTYSIQRPFYVATLGEASGLAKDFIGFILSAEGQAAVSKRCVAIDDNASAYSGDAPSGKLVVGGSSSVTPVMQDLIDAYKLVNPNAAIELQESDSGKGMSDAKSGAYDIGMASRALKDSEIDDGLVPVHIALDGIAVIVNNDNPLTGLTGEQVRNIYNGEIIKWEGVQ